jgi:hypothetical protein
MSSGPTSQVKYVLYLMPSVMTKNLLKKITFGFVVLFLIKQIVRRGIRAAEVPVFDVENPPAVTVCV